MSTQRVVVFTPDVVGQQMAGPGIRAYHFAKELANHFQTTLVAQLVDFDSTQEPFAAISRRGPEAVEALRRADVVIGQPTRELLALDPRRQMLVFDLFDPVVLELRELYANQATLRQRIHLRREWGRLHAALRRGTLFIAATPRQRDFYAGVYATASGKIRDWAERWIEVPFGVEDEEPRPADITPCDDAPLVIWGGGTWEWLDPETAVAAIQELNRQSVRCRLLFLGGERPNRELPRLGNLQRLRSLIASAGDLVILNNEWIPYRERARWLRAGKVAIMLHRQTLEAEFSIRTRLFDALWCVLPIVATRGGFAAELVQEEGLGVVVEPSDVSAVASGIEKLLCDDGFYAQSVSNLKRIRQRYRWSEVIHPLVRALEQRIG